MPIAPPSEPGASAVAPRCDVTQPAAPSTRLAEMLNRAAAALRAAGLPAQPLDQEARGLLRALAPCIESLTVPAAGDGALLLLALPASDASQSLLTALQQAALGVQPPAGREPPAAGAVLDEETFCARVDDEIARARRYTRELALVVLRGPSAGTAAQLGAMIAPRVRRWDTVGALSDEGRELGVLLPETNRGGALGFLNRWRGEMQGAEAGAGVFPADGRSAAELLALARMRITPVGASRDQKGTRGTLWFRGAPAGLGPETVLCPACLQAYSRGWLRQADRAVAARDRAAAEEWLATSCPAHEERIAVPSSVPRKQLPALLPADAPAMTLLARLRAPEPRSRTRSTAAQ